MPCRHRRFISAPQPPPFPSFPARRSASRNSSSGTRSITPHSAASLKVQRQSLSALRVQRVVDVLPQIARYRGLAQSHPRRPFPGNRRHAFRQQPVVARAPGRFRPDPLPRASPPAPPRAPPTPQTQMAARFRPAKPRPDRRHKGRRSSPSSPDRQSAIPRRSSPASAPARGAIGVSSRCPPKNFVSSTCVSPTEVRDDVSTATVRISSIGFLLTN